MPTVVGTKQGITEKASGWFTIEVALPGKDYPLRLDTKKQELVELARAAGENVMEWTYTEKDSGNPNPHRPGENFINRYFEGVAPVGTGGSANGDAPAAAPKDALSKDEWLLKDRAADLRACIAIAAGALQHTVKSEPTDDDLVQFARRAEKVARLFHGSVVNERLRGDEVPFLSQHDQEIAYPDAQ